ncbi:hypothetical protein ACGFSB_17690 [Streptomyces sp. NPDC048441]|uniref:hypothetical protein n=1 Tax=Streptomyces sp. NPDC048441 TaxID=3365552 RepID=UPI00371FC704
MSDKSRVVFNFGDAEITFGGDIVLGDQVGVSGGVVYGDVVMGAGVKTEETDDE